MQIPFSRLAESVNKDRQLFTIIYNLDLYYAQHVAALDISTIEELHQVCQRLELAKPPSRNTLLITSNSFPIYRRESRSAFAIIYFYYNTTNDLSCIH